MGNETASGRPLEVELEFEAKTYDIDFAGIVSNIVYIRWLEDLRLEMLRQRFPLDAQEMEGVHPLLIRTEVDYRKAVRYGEHLQGRMWVAKGGRVRWTLQAEFIVDGAVAAEARQVGLFVMEDTGKPVRVPAALQKALEDVESGSA
ncbi:MAG: acyl-CoA thioesterase [Anaerolineales bacterium]|nr:acyl-CoA thioesterase [Anaerolineales bacterium]